MASSLPPRAFRFVFSVCFMTATIPVPTPCLILTVRQQYHSCRIQLSDSDEQLAAIAIQNNYYSLFQVVKEADRVIDMIIRLGHRGDEIALQISAKACKLWVKEMDAVPIDSSISGDRSKLHPPKPSPCYILAADNRYQVITISVPDLDKSLSAIQVNGQYYSLFKPQSSADQVLQLVEKLARRDDETVIIASPDQSYDLYVLEPDAVPV